MNTPAHVIASLVVWRKHHSSKQTSALLTGALLPDIPMFLFFAVVRSAGYSGEAIWGTLYFNDNWQLFFDTTNSLPLFGLIALVAWSTRRSWWLLCAGSAILHIACDFLLHHDDAHRHFLPLSDYRFQSPVSYWDPDHFGIPMALIEAKLTIAASCFLIATTRITDTHGKLVRWTAILTLILYAIAGIGVLIWLAASGLEQV